MKLDLSKFVVLKEIPCRAFHADGVGQLKILRSGESSLQNGKNSCRGALLASRQRLRRLLRERAASRRGLPPRTAPASPEIHHDREYNVRF